MSSFKESNLINNKRIYFKFKYILISPRNKNLEKEMSISKVFLLFFNIKTQL